MTSAQDKRAGYVATRAFVEQVRDFTRELERRKESVARYLALAAAPPPNAPPELEGALETITEQHEELAVAQEELDSQIEALDEAIAVANRDRRRYRELFAATPVPLLILDRAGAVREANDAASALFDADAATLRGRALAGLAAAGEGSKLVGLLETGRGSTELTLARVRGATFTAVVTWRVVEHDDRILVALQRFDPDANQTHDGAQLARALRDTKDLLERERALRDRAERSDRAKDRFIGVLSHDLRGPINAVLGWTRILRAEHMPKDDRLRALETIERSTRTQLRLVEELLDLTRIAADKVALELRPVDLRACARNVIESMSPLAVDGGVHLTADLPEDPVPIFVDHERIVQVLTNLLANAIKFTARGGHICVRVRSDPHHAVLDVEDDGQGIEPSMLPELFECYRQGSGRAVARSGLGLGLYIVRRLVELHGGTVEAASEGRGRGARFTVRLALATADVQSDRTVTPDESSVDLERIRVLVVDDDPDSRDLFATVLSQDGATVFAASDASEAFAMFESCAPDIVVSDLDMPGCDGFELIRRIHARSADVAAVAVSGLAAKKDAERAYDAGFDAHLAKPVDAHELAKRVRELSLKLRQR